MATKKITPCVANVLIALRATAKAHNAQFEDWTDEGQVGINKESVPVLADVTSILRAFYKPEFVEAEADWGYTTAYIYDDYYNDETGETETAFLPEVDEMTLKMALPHDAKPRWKRG